MQGYLASVVASLAVEVQMLWKWCQVLALWEGEEAELLLLVVGLMELHTDQILSWVEQVHNQDLQS